MHPVASFISFVNHLEVTFTDTSTRNPTSWAWNFGDNGTSAQQNPVHTYASAGSRTVSLTATNTGGSDTDTATVTAIAPSTPGSPDNPLVSITPTSFTFSWSEPDTGGDPIVDYTFEYRREGVTSWIADTTVNRSYIVSGLSPNTNYEVRIRARNSLGNGVFSTRSTFTTSRLSMLLFDDISLPDLNINLHANFGETSPVTQPIPGSDGVWAISRGPGRADKGVIELQTVINVQDPNEMEDERRAIYALQNLGFRRLTYNLRNQSYAVYCEARIESITMDFDDAKQTNLMQPVTIRFEVPDPKWYEDVQSVWRFNNGLQFDTSYNGIALRFDNTDGVSQAAGSALNLTAASTDFNVDNEYEFTISTKSTTTTLLSTVIRTTITTINDIPNTNVICSLQRIVDGVAVDSFIYYHDSPQWTANTPLAIQTQYNILQWDGDDLPGRRTDGRYILVNHPDIFRLQPGDNRFIFKTNNPNVNWSIIGDYRPCLPIGEQMTTNHHNPITFKAQADVASINTPLSDLDSAISNIINGVTEIDLNASDFSSAQHDHSNATNANPIAESGIATGSHPDGVVMTKVSGVSSWARASGDALPGDIIPSARTAKNGWLICNGAAVSRITYLDLFDEIGITFGAGNGSSTFNIPDLRGRYPAGLDNMGGVSRNGITNTEADSLGGTFGGESVVLTEAQMPTHTHETSQGESGSSGQTVNFLQVGTGTSISETGSGDAHNNLPPTLFLNYFVKY